MGAPVLAIIGGSGVYELSCIENIQRKSVSTPFGSPSGELTIGTIGDRKVVFLARHGSGHPHSPTTVPYRANIFALKNEGATDILSISAVGSLREEYPPGHFVLVDQFIDRSFARPKTFFDKGAVAHVSMASPICLRMSEHISNAANTLGYAHTKGGTYLCMEGPQFSTRAESELYRSWGCSVVGMTNMPEAKLAREAEICYATLAMVTDYDCWHPEHDHVEVSDVIAVLKDNASRAQALTEAVAQHYAARPQTCPQGCDTALDNAFLTAAHARDPQLVEKLAPILKRSQKL